MYHEERCGAVLEEKHSDEAGEERRLRHPPFRFPGCLTTPSATCEPALPLCSARADRPSIDVPLRSFRRTFPSPVQHSALSATRLAMMRAARSVREESLHAIRMSSTDATGAPFRVRSQASCRTIEIVIWFSQCALHTPEFSAPCLILDAHTAHRHILASLWFSAQQQQR